MIVPFERRPLPVHFMNALRRLLTAALLTGPLPASAQDSYVDLRQRLVDQIVVEMQATSRDTGLDKLRDSVLRAMRTVPRHRFVPPELVAESYRDRPLPIGLGQTISQPFIVALMTELLDPRPDARVLEIGTGSGYQAAVLAECVAKVYTIEIVAPLGARAREVLSGLGYKNVEVRIGDGYKGWPEAAPFDAIIVTAAPDHIPQPLLEQLAPKGRMVIPVGSRHGIQDLLVITKDADGRAVTERTIAVRFVPLTREK
jgi:protein-L-isoaspartate(D-aspartate) O-methyltransferase